MEYYLNHNLPIEWAKEYEERCGGGSVKNRFENYGEAEKEFSEIPTPIFDKYSFADINGVVMYLKWYTLDKEEWDDEECIEDSEVIAEKFPMFD